MIQRLQLQKFLLMAVLLTGISMWGQINMTTTGSNTQQFSTLATSGTSNTFTNNSTISGWYTQRTGTGTTYAADNGSSNGGNLYSYGTGTTNERALGSLGSGNAAAGSFAHGVLLRNTSGTTITDIKVTYTLEQWRNAGGTVAAQPVTFWYQISSSPISNLTPNTNTGWTQVTGLTLSSPVNSGTAGSLDGNATANKVTASNISISGLSLANNDYIMLKWEDPDHSGTDHGLAIDDVTINWTVSSSTPTINTSVASLSGFTYVSGSGPSVEQSFTVEGSNLTGSINLAAPTNYEISTNAGSGYGAAVSLTPTGGTVNATTIFVRLKAGLAVGSYNSETITISSNGATDKTVSLSGSVTTAQPEIDITQGATAIATAGTYAFGSQVVSTSSSAITFTISNTGVAPLSLSGTPKVAISGTNVSEFSVNESATSATVAASGTTTFTVTFAPTSLGSKSAQLSIANNDSNENPYIINLTGTGTASAASDIIRDATFTEPSNIAYASFQATDITTANSVVVGSFVMRDGGGTTDSDTFGTTLTALTFSVANGGNIRRLALYDGTTELAEVAGATSAAFSSFSTATTDGGTKTLTLRATFTTSVTDNQQLQFTVSSATAGTSGSAFAATNAGGASTSTTGDSNRIEVTADRLRFGTQPAGSSVDVALSAFTVETVDINNNVDLDYTTTLTLTTSGTGMTASASYTINSGSVSISNVTFNAEQSNITITAATTGLAASNTVTSSAFSISNVANGTFRTLTGGTWLGTGTATWQRFTGGSWQSSSAPNANTQDIIIIRHVVSSNAIFAASGGGGTKLRIENGGSFTVTNGGTIGQLNVENGGTFTAGGTAGITFIASASPNLVVESGGRFVIDNPNTNSSSAIWSGNENFKSGSILEIKNWDYTAASNANRLIQTSSLISLNSSGYYFGNIEITGSPGSLFVMVQGSQTVNLAENNFRVNLSGGNNVAFTNASSNVTIGGNAVVDAGQLSATATTSGNPVINVQGDVIINGGTLNVNQNSSSAISNLQVFRNLIKNGGTLSSSDPDSKITFAGTIEKNPVIVGGIGSDVDFEIASGATVRLTQNFPLSTSGNSFTVLDGGILDVSTFTMGSNGSFAVNSGGTLRTSNTNGLQGSIQTTTANTTYTAGANYVFNAATTTPYPTSGLGNPGTLTFNAAVTSNRTANLGVANVNVNAGGSYTFNNNSVDNTNTGDGFTLSGTLTVAENATFTSPGENRITSGGGSPAAVINGTFITRDADGLRSTNATMSSGISLTLGSASTVEYGRAGNQDVTSAINYANLVISGTGEKRTTTSTPDISGTVTIRNGATLNVANYTFGGSATNLVMEQNSLFINSGASTKPDISGSFTLDPTSRIEFTGTSGTLIRTAPTYGNITISGTNVSLSTDNAGVSLQSGTTFTVKSGATFNVRNTNGLSGASNTAVRNTNNPAIVLESGSTINYNRTGDQAVTALPYANLTISGSGVKSTSADIASISGTVTVNSNTTLATSPFVFGTGTTPINVAANGTFIVGGAGVKPDIANPTLAAGSTVEFAGSGATTIRTTPTYGNVTVSGANVGLASETDGVTLQSGSTFTVKNGGQFNVANADGLLGTANAAVRNTNNPAVVLEALSTINYNRNGEQVVRASVAHGNVLLSVGGAKTLENGLVISNNLTLANGPTVALPPATNITVTNKFTNNGPAANFTIANNANLLQVNNVANEGSLVAKRNSSPLFRQDYTFWSAPVSGQNLLAFSPATLTNRFYTYNTSTDLYNEIAPATNSFEPGRGYLIRMPNGALLNGVPTGTFTTTGADYQQGSTTMTFNGSFTGVPNNGTISVALTDAGQGFNLIGNPYPSPINITSFLVANNSVIEGTVWIWRKKNASTNTSYVTYNSVGVYTGNGEPEQEDPNGVLRTGQGFIVKLLDANVGTTVNFTNAIRSNNTSNQFFRMSSSQLEKHGMWLNLTNSSGFFSQMYVGYIEGATNGVDSGIDSRYINDNPTVLATAIDNTEYIIQGRSLPFTASDVVPLLFKSSAAGNYTISLDHFDGLFAGGQDIFLRDNATGTTVNLKEGSYPFTTGQGTFANRFEIVFNSTLGTDNPALTPDAVAVYKQGGAIAVNAGTMDIASVTVFDLRGRMLYTKSGINATETVIENISAEQQVLIVQVTTIQHGTISRKIMF
ncbi:hypothetical protein CHU92_06620 [Flavobacterium cyanobacteriorum]|uniref:Choice-of-anchor D domain-containing protein n=1 Tax=Flavobacterium cyanobacteriorum TaxID=2022802 RepID=A0A255Z9G4_9FLAO|nr:choice-of-anchor D domain-containing protein [Flavobacterium cyanobacteriorum]OYQ38086.1 hypothetical protein CHU92_06620 [Flavobacterium cyanobacteriorum]